MTDYESLKLRDAVIDDLPGIVDIYNSTIPTRMVTADTEPVSVESRVQWFHAHSREHYPVWVLENRGVLCGWLSFQAFYGRPAYDATAELSIYVHDDYRKKGIGQYLLKEAVERSPKLGIKNLMGYIFAHNSPSLHLFYKLGFDEWGRLPGVAELDGIERDVVIVGKRL